MPFRILVPLDGSVIADRAVPLADQLAGALNAEVELLSVVPPGALNPRDTPRPFLYSDRIDEPVTPQPLSPAAPWFVHAPRVRSVVREGEPGLAIAHYAHESGADLIVMASHGHGGLKRALLGSVAEQTIEESSVPVLVVRAEVPEPLRLPKRVLVPLDGSLKSGVILQSAAPLAEALGWDVTLCSVVSPTMEPVPMETEPTSPLQATRWADAIAFLSSLASRLRERGVEVHLEAVRGEPAPTIAELAQRGKFGLVAMSTRGLYDPPWLANGSVTQYVGAHAHVPMLVIRPRRVPTEEEVYHWLRRGRLCTEPFVRRGLEDRAEQEHRRWQACMPFATPEGVCSSPGPKVQRSDPNG